MPIPIIQTIIYSFTMWFGLYLLTRDTKKPGLRFAGLGLITYALSIAVSLIPSDTSAITTLNYSLLMLPSIFWMWATLYLVPDVPIERLNQAILSIMVIILLLTLGTSITIPARTRMIAFALPIVFFIGTMIRLWQVFQSDLPRPPLVLLLTATIFFALSTGLIILPLQWISQDWVLIAISIDLIILGFIIGVLDAYDEGNAFLTDMFRSLMSASLATIVFGGQVIIVIYMMDNPPTATIFLLFATITTALVSVVFYDHIQSALDHILFSKDTQIATKRDDLRAVTSAVTRTDHSKSVLNLTEKEFNRLTRRALSHYGDLHKLASSPLLELPIITAQIEDDNILARANALKALLRDSIQQLKPSSDSNFMPTDEWRYYNVLYFPYIVGIKPYSSRFFRDDLQPAEQEALEWFRIYVPERTLYNWQKIAAELVAQNLRQMQHD